MSNALPRSLQRALARGKVDLADPAVTLELLKLDAVVGVTGFFDETGQHHVDGHSMRVLSLDRRRFVRLRHRSPAGWLGESRPQRRRDHCARAAARAGGQLLGADVATVRTVLNSWGPGRSDADVVPGWQGVPTGRQIGVSADSAGVRARGRQPAHLDRMGRRAVLECVRRDSRDARQGTFFDPRLDDATRFPIAARERFGHVVPKRT